MIDADAFLHAAALVEHRDTLEHEAAHASAGLLLGLDVRDAHAPFATADQLLDGSPEDMLGVTHLEGAASQRRAFLLSTLAGPLATGEAYWPPSWPLSLAPLSDDEAQVREHAEALGLDEDGYAAAVADAEALVASPSFKSLHAAITEALSREPYAVGRAELRHLQRKALEDCMLHTTKTATVTAADRGEFSAIAAAYSLDRSGDVIIPGAFAATIERWQASGKTVPLHWNHESGASNVIGFIDPAAMRETPEGLYVEGRLDLAESEVAREAWRSIKAGALSLSFGYLTEHETKRSDGVNELRVLDLYEISVVPAPANADTRFLSTKAAGEPDSIAAEWRDRMLAATGTKAAPRETLEEKAARVAAEVERTCSPIRIATFEC